MAHQTDVTEKVSHWIIAVLISLLPCSQMVLAQQVTPPPAPADTTQLWRVQTHDGNEFVGRIDEQTDEHVVLRTESLGIITIPRAQIRHMEPIDVSRIVGKEVWADNPQASRYFWAPNGYGLKQGEGYYQNVWIFFNQLSYGLSDYATIGVGIVPLFLFEGTPSPMWLTPKLSLPLSGPNGKVRMGTGVLIGTVVGDNSGAFGITYGTLTIGSRDMNTSLGLGYGFADGEWATQPVVTLGLMARMSRRGYFLSENYLIDNVGLISLGGRFVGSNMSFDYGLIIPVESGGISIAVPWIGLVVPIQGK